MVEHPDDPGFGAGTDASSHVMLVVIVRQGIVLEAVLTSLINISITGTVLDGKALLEAVREEMPIFGGLGSMLPGGGATRVVLCVTPRDQAREALLIFQSQFQPSDRPIALAFEIAGGVGLRR